MSSASRSLSQNKPKTPSKLRKSVTARSSSSRSATNNADSHMLPPPPPPLPPKLTFASTSKKDKKKSPPLGKHGIFSKDNPLGFLEIKGERGSISQLTEILDEEGNTKTYTHTKVQNLSKMEINEIRENNERLRQIILASKKGGKKTRKHRKTKGKKYYKKRTLRKRK
jgi:hypothetical protein